VRCWGFEHWASHALYSNFFQLCVWAIRCCSHLAWPCVVFHRWVGKTCGALIDRSCDAWPESGDTTGVVLSTRVGKCDRSQIIGLDSYLLTGIGHTTEVTSFDKSQAYDQSWAYDRSCIFQTKSGIQLESCIRPESCDTCIIIMYNGSYMIWKFIHCSEYNKRVSRCPFTSHSLYYPLGRTRL
jgi:hypothetical protein